MSERYCYDRWQSSLNELQTLLNENTSPSKDKDHLAKAYLRFLQVLKEVNEVHTYIRQPQHREAVGTAVLCCAALLTEYWSALVTANKGIDVIDFGSYLLELQLTPDDLEVPLPAVLKASDRLGQAKLKAALTAAEASTVQATDFSVPEEPLIATLKYSTKALPNRSTYPKSLPLDASVEITSSPDEAATKIQSAWRGWRDRQSAADKRWKEHEYVGMSRNDNMSTDIQSLLDLEEGAVARRERRRREYEQARLEIEALLQVQETPLMVLEEINQINAWLDGKIKMEGDRWPEVPLDGELLTAAQDGIIPSSENQIPKLQGKNPKLSAFAGDAASSFAPGKARKLGAGSGSNFGSTNANEASKSSAVPTFASQLEVLIKKWKVTDEQNLKIEQDQQGVWGIGTDTATADADTDATSISDAPLPALEGLPVPRRGSSIDAIDFKLLTTATRPLIKEKVRLTVRERARQTAAAANAARPAPAAAKQKQTAPSAKPSSKVPIPTLKKPDEKPTPAANSSKRAAGNKEDKEPKREPLPPPRDLEEILKELAEQQIALKCPEMNLRNFTGTCCLVPGSSAAGDSQPTPVRKAKSGGKAANIAAKTSEPLVLYPEPSFAQIRQLLTAKCALPLAIQGFIADQKLKTQIANGRNCPVTGLIYGPRGSGKTMLVHAVAHESKASLFDLSPKKLARKYPGQQTIDVAVQSVFAAAKAAAPAIIYIDNVEQLFIRDENRVAQLAEEIGGPTPIEPVGRIRRQLLIEVAALKPEDDDRCRRAILEELAVELKCLEFWTAQQLTLAAQLTPDYTAGQLKIILIQSLDLFRASKGDKVDLLDYFIEAIAAEVKTDSVELQTVAEWTARAHAMLGKAAASLK
ncbi:hypothetical protein Ndes2437B_g03942 [Nannochloris sp. 'desiccata']